MYIKFSDKPSIRSSDFLLHRRELISMNLTRSIDVIAVAFGDRVVLPIHLSHSQRRTVQRAHRVDGSRDTTTSGIRNEDEEDSGKMLIEDIGYWFSSFLIMCFRFVSF
jgi:hypothetical protein